MGVSIFQTLAPTLADFEVENIFVSSCRSGIKGFPMCLMFLEKLATLFPQPQGWDLQPDIS